MRPRSSEEPLSRNPIRSSSRAALAAALTTLMLAAIGPWAVAQESAEPDWSQYQGGAGHAGSLEDGPQPPFRVRWTLPAPAGEALSGAIVLGDVAVSVGSEAVYGVDVATGTVVWEIPRAGGPLSMPAAGQANGSPVLLYLEGPEASAAEPSPDASETPSPTPTASGSPGPETVGPEVEEPASFLVAVSPEGRAELWRVPLQAITRSGVTVDDATAYVGDQAGHVVAVALEDGSVTWTAQVPGRVDAPVAVSDGRVYAVARDRAAGQATVVALDATTGERAWAVVPQATSTAASAPSAGDGSVLVGAADRLMHSLAAQDGAERWGALVLSFFSPATAPALADGAVYAADLSGGLYRFDAADGDRDWSFQLNEVVVRSAPVASGPTILLGLNDGRLVAIDSGTGHLVWESEATPGLVGTIALGPDVVIAVKGGKDAGLIAFEHDDEGALLDLPSPTELETGTTLSRYGLAATIVLIAALIPGIALRRRLGPAALSSGEGDGEQDEVEDLDDAGDGVDGT